MFYEYIRFAGRNITKKGVRSWLTMLGIFVGIAAVVSLISLGQGMDDAIRSEFAKMGSDIIIVMPGSGFQSLGSVKLSKHDEDLIGGVRGVERMAPFIAKFSKVTYGREVKYLSVNGMPVDDRYQVLENMGVKITEGRRPQSTDKYKVLIGSRLGSGDVYKGERIRVNDRIDIEGHEFRVVGILDTFGNQQDDETLWIPLDTAKEAFNEKGYDEFVVEVKSGYNASEVSENIKSKMRRDRGQKEGEEDFMIQTSEQLLESVGGILSSVQAVLVGIALISLMVGGIGIMNTMYTGVLERTREIGVLKAVGAQNRDIMMMFLVESGMLGAVGGAVGAAIGLAMSKTVEYYAQATLGNNLLKASTAPELIIGAVLFSFVVGCLSGVLPAMQASRQKPVEALRYE